MNLLKNGLISRYNLVFLSYFAFILFAYFDFHISRSFIFFIGLLFFMSKNVKSTFKKLIQDPFYLSIVIFVIYVILSILWSNNFRKGIGLSKIWLTLLMIPFFNEMLEDNHKKLIYYAFIPVFIYISIWILFINTGIIPLNYKLRTFDVIPGSSYIKVSFFLGILFIITVNRLQCDKSIKRKYPYIALLILIIAEVFMLESRGGQLALLTMIYILIILLNKNHIIKGFIVSTLIIILILFSSYNFNDKFKNRIDLAVESLTLLTKKNYYNTSSGSRIGLWIIASDMMREKPLLGTGVGGYCQNFKRIFKEKYEYMGQGVFNVGNSMMHNELIQILVKFGIIGFMLYLNMFFQFFKTAIKNKNGFTAILFLTYYFTFTATYVPIERHQLLYTFVIAMTLIAYKILCKDSANGRNNENSQ